DRGIRKSSPALRQNSLQFFLGLEEPRLRGSFRNLQDRGDLAMPHALHFEEEKYHAVPRMNPRERLFQLDPQREVRSARAGHFLASLFFALAPSSVVVTDVDQHPAEP